MKQPETILPNGTLVRTHKQLKHHFPGPRRTDTSGSIDCVVGGMGGDVYMVRHNDGTGAAYCFDEFELESDQSSCSTDKYDKRARIDDIHGDELLVRWDIDPPMKGVISLAPRRYDSATLDLAGIAALRAALDKAEATWRERTNLPAPPDNKNPYYSAAYKELFGAFDHLWMHVARMAESSGGPPFRHADTFNVHDRKAEMSDVLVHLRDKLVETKAQHTAAVTIAETLQQLAMSPKQGAIEMKDLSHKKFEPKPTLGGLEPIVPGTYVHLLHTPEPPIDAHELAEAEKLVRAGYVFNERAYNTIICERDSSEPSYKLTDEQTRIFHAALVNGAREAMGQPPIYVGEPRAGQPATIRSLRAGELFVSNNITYEITDRLYGTGRDQGRVAIRKLPSPTECEPNEWVMPFDATVMRINNIGQRIRAARRAAGKNLEDAAKAMETSIPHASALERGKKFPTTEEIAKLAALFGVDAKELMG